MAKNILLIRFDTFLNKSFLSNNLTASSGSCSNPVIKAFNTGKIPLDAHAALPNDTNPNYNTNFCLNLASGVTGSVSCIPRVGACNSNEMSVVSLYQPEDSHVSAFNYWSNNVCCSVNICPSGFVWNAQTQTCSIGFQACLVQSTTTGKVDQTQACKTLWASPNSSNKGVLAPYWIDSVNQNFTNGRMPTNDFDADDINPNCFQTLPSNPQDDEVGISYNAQACCYSTTGSGNNYGQYSNVNVIQGYVNLTG